MEVERDWFCLQRVCVPCKPQGCALGRQPDLSKSWEQAVFPCFPGAVMMILGRDAAGYDVVLWGSSKGTPPVLPVFRQGHLRAFQALLRHQTTVLHSKGQDWPFPASNVCLKDKPRQDLLNFGMLHMAMLILEGWVFTSVQSIK